MTLFLQLRDKARPTRHVVIGQDQQVDVQTLDPNTPKIQASLTPSTSAPDPAAPPRDQSPSLLRWASGFRGPGVPISIGDRVVMDSDGQTYEIIEDPRPLRSKREIEGYESSVKALPDLYPLVGDIKHQDDTILAGNVPCSVWGGVDTRNEAGTYEDRDGELPVEFADQASEPNAMLVVGSQRLRIVQSVPEVSPPRVRLSLRRPGG